MEFAGSRNNLTRTLLEPYDPYVKKSTNILAIPQYLKKTLNVLQIKIL